MQSIYSIYFSSWPINSFLGSVEILNLVKWQFVVVMFWFSLIKRNSVSVVICNFHKRLIDVFLGRSCAKGNAFLHINISFTDWVQRYIRFCRFWAICWVVDLNASVTLRMKKIWIWHTISSYHLSIVRLSVWALLEILFSLIKITLSVNWFSSDFIFFSCC